MWGPFVWSLGAGTGVRDPCGFRLRFDLGAIPARGQTSVPVEDPLEGTYLGCVDVRATTLESLTPGTGVSAPRRTSFSGWEPDEAADPR